MFKVFQFLFELRKLAVFQLSRLVQVILTLCLLYFTVHLFYLLTELLNSGYIILFVLPLCLHAVELLTQLCKFLLYLFKVLLRDRVAFLFKGSFLYFKLNYLT